MKIDGYHITEKIGEGGIATVYHGVQTSLNRPVAIKVLSQQLQDDSDINERFLQESLIIAKLNHPHIIHVIDRGLTDEGRPYFIMEYVQGHTLEEAIRTDNLTLEHKIDLSAQICKALSYAHKNKVIHRDIKPANIFIDHEGNARVLDFGIAHWVEANITKKHSIDIMGTMAYMSPEQRSGSLDITPQSDLYSLGVTLYQLFTHCLPQGTFRPAQEVNNTLPQPLSDLIGHCLQKEPSARPSSADEVRDRLLSLLQGAHLNAEQIERANQGMTAIKNKFALLDIIKESLFGAVYLFEEQTQHRLLIIKKRFTNRQGFTENQLLTNLKHPHIANILGVSKNERVFIIVMEYLNGGTLVDRLIRPYPTTDFLQLATQMCQALQFAHNNRVVHGNLRPSNILFSNEGIIKISDFGLDEHYTENNLQINWYNPDEENKSITADIFALGVIFYQMLTGNLPTWEEKKIEPEPLFTEQPAELQRLIHAMMARNPIQRPFNMGDILTQLNILAASAPTVRLTTSATIPETTKTTASLITMKWAAMLVIAMLMGAGLSYLLQRLPV